MLHDLNLTATCGWKLSVLDEAFLEGGQEGGPFPRARGGPALRADLRVLLGLPVCPCVVTCLPVRIAEWGARGWGCWGSDAAGTAATGLPCAPPQEQKFCQRYDQLMEAWEKKVERIENNPRRRAKESKVREYYEKQFPEIRKQRELQERMQR